MIAGRSVEILRQLEVPIVPDCELLARFERERDQSAFTELVQRHGPVVLGVCKRVTGHQQDSEDAFQAVFLLLARKLSTIGKPELVGNWLYGAAVRVALTSRRAARRRRAHEVLVNSMPDPSTSPREEVSDLNPILDEELAALPNLYREAIVLCDIRGVSRQEAAITLGIPQGTLSSRLASGRKKLAARLTKRGIALSAAAIPTAITTQVAVAVPNVLVVKTCALVKDWLANGTVPKPFIKLTEGGLTVRQTFIIGLVTAVVVSGIAYAFQPTQNPTLTDSPKEPVVVVHDDAAEQPLPNKAGNTPITYTSSPKVINRLNVSLYGNLTAIWNPQGTRLAIAGKVSPSALPPRNDKKEQSQIDVYSFDPTKRIKIAIDDQSKLVGFTHDGGQILTELREYQLLSGFHKLEVWSETSVRTVDLDPMETEGYAFAVDGKTFRTVAIDRDLTTGDIKRVHVLEVNATTGTHIKTQLSVDADIYALSPDGQRFAFVDQNEKVVVYQVDRGIKLSSYSLRSTPKEGEQGGAPGLTNKGKKVQLKFSPDGHRILVIERLDSQPMFAGRFNVAIDRIRSTFVLNADTGESLPALEDLGYVSTYTNGCSFSGDGKLVAISGARYGLPKKDDPTGPPSRYATLQAPPYMFLTVWNTETGKMLKTWNHSPQVAFNPVRPILAVLEPHNDGTRLGLWDFSAETPLKK